MSGDGKKGNQGKGKGAKNEQPKDAPAKEAPVKEAVKEAPAKEQAKAAAKVAESPKKAAPAKEQAPAKEAPAKEQAKAAAKAADSPKKEAKKPAAKEAPAKAAAKEQTKAKGKRVPRFLAAPKATAAKTAQPITVAPTGAGLPTVPASILKKRKASAARAQYQLKKIDEARKKRKLHSETIFKRAEQYVKEYRDAEKSIIDARRQAKKEGNFYLEAEPKLALVIRIRGTQGLAPKPRKILQLLRLRQINNAVFVKLSKPMLNMLRVVDPYITWGTPSLATVRNLVYKRGYGKVNNARTALTSNALVQQVLGKQNIICMEDLIHEIFTVGPNFKVAANFLWPFKLNPPRGGFRLTLKHVNEGGDFGYRADGITALARRMI